MQRILIISPTNTAPGRVWTSDFMTACERMHDTVPLSRVRFVKVEGTSPDTFDYIIEAQDGRTWRQRLTFDQASPKMAFNQVKGAWRVAEFEPHRAVRAALVALYQSQNAITSVDWRVQ